jgi:hypothetical protein
MSGFVQNLLADTAAGFFGNAYVRDYTHAAKTFRTNSYQYSPKLKFLFHVYFEINPAVYSTGIASGANFGLAVKTIKLPSYQFDTHIMNQYNRKRIVQTKLKYDPIDIQFHDDNGNIIRNMWYDYYTYYYKDANKPTRSSAGAQTVNAPGQENAGATEYNRRNIYDPSITGDDDWGYIGEVSVPTNTTSQASQGISKIPFFKNIQVFGFNQHNFSLYTLINPTITRFAHDTYDYAQGNGTMANTMTVDYETVTYQYGAISGRAPGNIVKGFGSPENYDRTLSPIARLGSNATIIGQGGLVEAGEGVISDILDGNYLRAIQTAGTTYNTFKNKNLKQVALSDVNTVLQTATQEALPGGVRSNTYYPGFGLSGQIQAAAGSAGSGLTSPPKVQVK